MRLDLHVHTSASDGVWSADQVVEGALDGGLDILAVTDHDTTAGSVAAQRAAQNTGLRVIPGVELSSTRDGRELHVLGYFVDPSAPVLSAFERDARELRAGRMAAMIDRLRSNGFDVDMEDVFEAAGSEHRMLARPHLARALVARGLARSESDAFDRLIGDQQDAFVPTALQDPVEAIRVVRDSGGVAVWAHPPRDVVETMLPELHAAGLRGLEVYRPNAHPRWIQSLLALAERWRLLTSGGSDWHDPNRNGALGAFHVESERVEGLLSAGGM